MFLVVRVKVGPMMLPAGFDEHPNDDAEESRELRHSHTVASSATPFDWLPLTRVMMVGQAVTARRLWSAVAMSRGFAPRAKSPRSSRSIETVASAASIFATRDWLDFKRLANLV